MKKKKDLPVRRERPDRRRAGVHAPQWLARETGELPRTMLCGREYMVVENCGCVTEFSPERICMATAIGPVRIEGGSLTISRESGHTAVILGRIDRILLGEANA